jgi:3-dehydroquinate synthetase
VERTDSAAGPPADARADPVVIVGALAPLPPLDPPPSRTLVLVDDGVPREHDPGILAAAHGAGAGDPPALVRVSGGEARKSITGWGEILELCDAARLDRDSLLVAAGGGALGDAAGFAAASWHRGIRWVAMPTTLVAMIDAHLGGKTALNFGGVKNPIGAFWWPVAVLADPRFLSSLPAREVRSGWGEMVKAALIGDAPLFAALESEAREAPGAPTRLPSEDEIHRAIAVKRRVVAADPLESDRRRVLNLGHTLGHALESLPGSALAHGEAVAAGLVFAAELAADLGRAPRSLAGRIAATLARHRLPTGWPRERAGELLERIASDKKRRRGEHWFALPAEPGAVGLVPVAAEAVRSRLEAGPEEATRGGGIPR